MIKIRDLEKARQSGKRSLEKDNLLQLNLLNKFKRRKKLEVLRMEVRLGRRQKIKQFFKTLGIKSDLTFKKLFKPAISKKILLYYLDELESKRPVLLDYKARNDKAFLAALVLNNLELRPKQILQMFGLKKILETATLRELRGVFAKHNAKSWYRLMADTNKIKLPMMQSTFGVIRNHLVKFKPVRVERFY